MSRQLRCRTCQEPIILIPRPGFIIRGQPKSFAVNADDRQPHGRRCKLTMELRELRRSKSPDRPNTKETPAKREELRRPPTQKELPL